MREVVVRRAEPEDHEAVNLAYSSLDAMADTPSVPSSPKQDRREKLSERRDDVVHLVARVRDEVVGHLALMVCANPGTRHSGHFGAAVRDGWQGRGVGAELARAALDLAGNASAVAPRGKFGSRNADYVDAHVGARLK